MANKNWSAKDERAIKAASTNQSLQKGLVNKETAKAKAAEERGDDQAARSARTNVKKVRGHGRYDD